MGKFFLRLKNIAALKKIWDNKLLSVAMLLLIFQQVHFCQKELEYEERLATASTKLNEAQVTIFKNDDQIRLLDEELQKVIDKKDVAVKELIEFKASIEATGKPPVKTKTIYVDKEVVVYTEPNTGIDVVPGLIYRATSKTTFQPLKSFVIDIGDHRVKFYALFTPNTDPNVSDAFNVEAEYNLRMNIVGQIVKTINNIGDAYHLRLFEVKDGKIIGGIPTSDFAVMVRDLRINRVRLWAPKIDISATSFPLQLQDWATEIGFSTSGYGVSDNDLTWRFFRTSIGITNNRIGVLGFTPAMWNLGRMVPIIDNVFVGPSVYMNTSRDFNFGLTIGVSL